MWQRDLRVRSNTTLVLVGLTTETNWCRTAVNLEEVHFWSEYRSN